MSEISLATKYFTSLPKLLYLNLIQLIIKFMQSLQYFHSSANTPPPPHQTQPFPPPDPTLPPPKAPTLSPPPFEGDKARNDSLRLMLPVFLSV